MKSEILIEARRLRRGMEPIERELWDALKWRQLGGLKFRRKAVIQGAIADFYCPRYRMVVIVSSPDGERLRLLGYRVVYIRHREIMEELPKVLGIIRGMAHR